MDDHFTLETFVCAFLVAWTEGSHILYFFKAHLSFKSPITVYLLPWAFSDACCLYSVPHVLVSPVTLLVCLWSHPVQSVSNPTVGWFLQVISLTLEFSSALNEGIHVWDTCEYMWKSRETKLIMSRCNRVWCDRWIWWVVSFLAWIPLLKFLPMLNHACEHYSLLLL